MVDSIDDWKKYLYTKGIVIKSNRNFNKIMQSLDLKISSVVSSTKGMIWRKGQLNPTVTIADVDSALNLLAKFGQANLDDLGDPTAADARSGSPINQMFISQEDSKLDGFSPGTNQNQSRTSSTVPLNVDKENNKLSQPSIGNINDRMALLTKLIESEKNN